jgi:hypothetical protein
MLFVPEDQIAINIPLGEPRLMQPDLLIPGRKPIGRMEVDRELAAKLGVIMYYPMLYQDRYAGQGDIRGYIGPDVGTLAFSPKNLTSSFLTPQGYETFGGASAYAAADESNLYNSAVDGAHTVTVNFGFTLKALSAVSQNENTILSFPISGSLIGLLIRVHHTTSELLIGARSIAGDTYQELASSNTVTVGTEYHCEAEIDYQNDFIRLNFDGVRDSEAKTFIQSTYNAGVATVEDGFGGTNSTARESELILHYVIIQKDRHMSSAPSPLLHDPYLLLKPEGPLLITNAEATGAESFPLPDIRMDSPQLLIPGRKPAGGAFTVDRELADKLGVVYYLPFVNGGGDPTTRSGKNSIFPHIIGNHVDPSRGFMINDPTLNEINSKGFETFGGVDCGCTSEPGFINDLCEGAHSITFNFGVTVKNFDLVSQDGNTILVNWIETADFGFIIHFGTNQAFQFNSQAKFDEAGQTHFMGGTTVEGKLFHFEATADFENDRIILRRHRGIGGFSQEITVKSVSYGSNIYVGGASTGGDGFMAFGATRESDMIMHYFMIRRDCFSEPDVNSSILLDPYQLLIPQ